MRGFPASRSALYRISAASCLAIIALVVTPSAHAQLYLRGVLTYWSNGNGASVNEPAEYDTCSGTQNAKVSINGLGVDIHILLHVGDNDFTFSNVEPYRAVGLFIGASDSAITGPFRELPSLVAYDPGPAVPAAGTLVQTWGAFSGTKPYPGATAFSAGGYTVAVTAYSYTAGSGGMFRLHVVPGETSFSATGGFGATNPSGRWSYGSKLASDPLGSFTGFSHLISNSEVIAWDDNAQGNAPLPFIAKNISDDVVADQYTHFDPHEVLTHPGPTRDAVLRFTASSSGLRTVRGFVRGLSVNGTSSGVVLTSGGASLFAANVNGDGTLVPLPVLSIAMAAGQTLDLITTKGDNNEASDSTGVWLLIDECAASVASPGPATVCAPGTAMFSMSAVGEVTYRWQRETTPDAWIDISTASFSHGSGSLTPSGAASPQLTLSASLTDGATPLRVRGVVTSTCGDTITTPATLTFCPNPGDERSARITNTAYVRSDAASGLNPQQFTLETWFRPDGMGYGASTDGGGAILINKPREGSSGSNLASWGMHWIPNDGRILLYVVHAFGTSSSGLYSNTIIPIGALTHCAATFDGTTLQLYINGQLDAEVLALSPVVYYAPDMPVLLGAGNFAFGDSRRFDGLLDEARIWDHARTAAEILVSYDCQPAGPQPGLLAAWTFNGDSLADTSGHGLDAVAVSPGSPGFSYVAQPAPVHACTHSGLVMASVSTSTCNASSTLTVKIDGVTGATNVAGAQCYIGWDASRLSLTSITPGPGLSTFYDVSGGAASRDFAVRIADGAPRLSAQTLATLTFAVSGPAACAASDLVFFRTNSLPSRMTDDNAQPVGSIASNLGPVTLDRTGPMFPTLASLAFDTTPNFCFARQTVSAAAIDDCAGVVPATAKVGTIPIAFPYDFPVGDTTITWSASDACGHTSTAEQHVIVTDRQLPVITCPAGRTVNADAGFTSAALSASQVGTPVASDACGVQSVIARIGGSTIIFPHTFARGDTTISWTATDNNGNTESCDQTITVTDSSTMTATVKLDGVSAGPITRCITFVLYRGACPPVATITADVTFTPGGGSVTLDVPAGPAFTAITITDTRHTLRRTSDASTFGVSGVVYAADFTSKPLVGGNINNDAYIDILDFGGYIGRLGSPTDASTPCAGGPAGLHADFSGDGGVGTEDFNFISFSFLHTRDADPCGGGVLGDGGPLLSISVHDPRVALLPGMIRADVNHDGAIDAADLTSIASRGLSTCPADFNNDGAATVADIFDFLSAWLAGHPATDVNGVGGANVQDIFDFLGEWFRGC